MQDKISFSSNLAKYGMGLFETIKVVNGQSVFLDEHLNRLYNSINTLDINFAIKKELLKKKIKHFASDLEQQALRVTICDQGYNFSTRDIPYQSRDYKAGYDLQISNISRGNNPLYKHKTTNYFTNLYARKKARNCGYDDALFLNSDNFILEAAVANIFFIKGDQIYTPSADLALLPGIIRNKVFAVAKELDLKVKEVILEKPELALFDFAFITNSLMGLMRVNKIDTIKYQAESEIFKQLKTGLKNREVRS